MAKARRTTKQSKQTGGTFLGIVLGLIVGLAIAVVVALYITRAPTPFVSKVAQPAASQRRAATGQPQYDPHRARPRRGTRQPAIGSKPSAARQDAGPTGAESRAARAAEYRAGPAQFANP